jgi:hypothetical protein
VFHSGDSIQCDLRFTRRVSEGLLQVRKDDKIQILTVKNVSHFRFLDETKQLERVFYNLTLIPQLSTRRHEVFVELVYTTKDISIVNHKTLGFSSKGFQINPFRKKAVVNTFYVVEKYSGLILPLNRTNMLQILDQNKTEVEAYLKSHNVRLKTVSDYISVLEFERTLR